VDTSPAGALLQFAWLSPISAVLLLGLVALVKRWIVLGWAYREKCRESDGWRDLYNQSQATLTEVRKGAEADRTRGDAAIETARVSQRLLELLHPGGDRAPLS
jgi:hypothetical protein